VSRRALYVCGSCLFRNTSANMSHHGFLRGLVENGYEVDVLMPSESFGPLDPGLPRVEGARYRMHSATSVRGAAVAAIRGWFDRGIPAGAASPASRPDPSEPSSDALASTSVRARVRAVAAGLEAARRRRDPHWASRTWLRRAARFSSSEPFDLVLSNSSPASGHRLAASLRSSRRVRADRWLQVWEDPWYHDVYRRGPAPRVLEEETALLRAADEIFYVSPLTLAYQRRHFPESAHKMGFVPLPAFPPVAGRREAGAGPPVFGYFGDYYAHTRDLRPLLAALRSTGARAEICGDSDVTVESSERIRVRGRVTLPVLAGIEADVDVLVAVCNLRGGQLPGKLYHYAATEKPVLLVLDGSPDERRAIREHFEPLRRFDFCENDVDSIERSLRGFLGGARPLLALPEPSFEAKAVVARLLGGAR